jgi:glycerate kinase
MGSMSRVLIVPDKFKGTLSASAAAGAIANGWWKIRPQDDIECLPMSDGGDGFGEIMAGLLGAEERSVATTDAAGRPREALWWFHADSSTAIIESAQIIGLALLPQGRYHPFELDTRGLGPVIRAAHAVHATKILIGVGGSATNDAGFGMARSIGWQFFDVNDMPIERWIKLDRLARWQVPDDLPSNVDYIVAVDVDNPLLGPNGCTRVYGPQKGLRTEQSPLAESCLERLAAQARQEYDVDLAAEDGAGAAGGLGFGFRAFLGARIERGFDIFSFASGLQEKISRADIVITGEGMIDRQTMMGKGTGQVAKAAREQGKICLGLAGSVDTVTHGASHDRLFTGIWGIAPGMASPAQAKSEAAVWLERLATKVASEGDW